MWLGIISHDWAHQAHNRAHPCNVADRDSVAIVLWVHHPQGHCILIVDVAPFKASIGRNPIKEFIESHLKNFRASGF
jgi:hypothetical protein